MIPARDQELLRQRLATDLTSRVRLDYFSQRPSRFVVPGRDECTLCEDGKVLLAEIAALSPKVSLTLHDLEDDAATAAALDVDHVPAIVIRGVTNRALRFFGIPSSAEFPVFVDTIIAAGSGKSELEAETLRKLKRVRSDVEVQVYMTPTCPHSPAVARAALRFGLASSQVKVDVIEAGEFPSLVQRAAIRAVPTVVFNQKLSLPGAMDETRFVDSLLRFVEGKPLGLADWQRGAVSVLQDQKTAQETPAVRPSGLVLPR
jgi:glutaredoxin-like protein